MDLQTGFQGEKLYKNCGIKGTTIPADQILPALHGDEPPKDVTPWNRPPDRVD